jgi:hypothetical protein
MEVKELLKFILYFCNYFNSKLTNVKDITIRGFFNAQIFKNEHETFWKQGKFCNDNGTKLCSSNFIVTTINLFTALNEHDLLSLNLHLDKENNIIFSFLANILNKNFKIDGIGLTNQQSDFLRIIHSKMSEVFNTHRSNYLDELLEARIKRFNINNQNDKSPALEIAVKDKDFIKVKRDYNKRIRYQNHINNFNIHLNNNPMTTPDSLFYCRFPWPMFKDDEDFIKKYYDIIEDTQKRIMLLNIEYLNEKITVLDQNLDVIKDNLIKEEKWDPNQNKENLDFITVENVFKECINLEERKLKNYLMKSKYKTERCKALRMNKDYFEKRLSSKKKVINQSGDSNDDSIESGSFSGRSSSFYSHGSSVRSSSILKEKKKYHNSSSYKNRKKNGHSSRRSSSNNNNSNESGNFRRVSFSKKWR